jgi:hypothetical protein
MRKFTIILAVISLASMFGSQEASAQSIEEKNVVKSERKFDSSSGYVFLHGATRQVGIFLRIPSQQDVAEFTKEWEAAFAKATEKYAKRLKQWELEREVAAHTKVKLSEKPVEPNAQNFSIGTLETRGAIRFGPEHVYSKDKAAGKYNYMMEVQPGTYIYHGPIFFDPQNGYVGTCFCMGSVQFEVKAGFVTDLGNFLTEGPNASDDVKVPTSAIIVPNSMFGATKIEARQGIGKAVFGLPDSLKGWPSVVADFRASAKSDNHFGVMVSRMPPIPGVLSYKRDRVVDEKTVNSPGL